MTSPVPNLEASDIRKVYPGTVALKGVSLAFLPGEVHALIGKNGAGKSTLVKIISGAASPTSGRLFVRGEPVELRSPRDAFQKGIATVYQELSLVPNLTVAHNIFLANLPTRWHGLCIDWPRIYRRAEALLHELQLDIDPRRPVRALSVATQQMVEIAKAMSFEPSLLLLDEPTSALARHETESLFRLIAQLRAKGVAIVYISHRLQELQQIAQRVSVLRDGELAGTLAIEEATPRAIAEMMFGGLEPRRRPINLVVREGTALEVRQLTRRGKLHGISFSLRQGEILGIAGVVGSGRSELLRAIAGVDRFDSGAVICAGAGVSRPTVRRMNRLGLGLTPENRKEEGLVLALNTRENICLASLNRIAKFGVITRGLQRPVVEHGVRTLQIKVPDTEAPVATLSGGNQQKVVVAKWLHMQPRVLLFDEPTRGIDLEAKQQIFQVLWDLSREGISSIFVSSELDELVEVCHRILILQDGRITGEVNAAEISPQQVFERCVAAMPPRESVAHG